MNSNTPQSLLNNNNSNNNNNNNGGGGGSSSPIGGQRASYTGNSTTGTGLGAGSGQGLGLGKDEVGGDDDEVAYCSSYVGPKVQGLGLGQVQGSINPSTAQRSGTYSNLPALIATTPTHASVGGTSVGGGNTGGSSGG